MTTEVDEAIHTLLSNRTLFIETLLQIEDKERDLVQFKLNPIEKDIIDTTTGRDIYVKPAQVGFSSVSIADYLIDTLTLRGTVAVIVSYNDFISGRLLRKAQLFYDILKARVPSIPELHHRSTSEKTFPDMHSSFYIGSAGSFAFGRGETIHDLLLDEYAFWQPGDAQRIALPTIQRVPLSGRVRIGCYDKDTEVLTKQGWVAFPDLKEDMDIFTKNSYTNQAYYTKPQAVQRYPYNGKMLHLNGKRLDLLVTPEHSVWVKSRTTGYGSDYKFRKASELTKSGALFDTSINWIGVDDDYFILPGACDKPDVRIPLSLWAEYLGYFLSEGYTDASSGTWLCQNDNSEHWFDMITASERLARIIEARHYEGNRKDRKLMEWCIRDKRLHSYLNNYTMPKILPDNMRFVKSQYMRILIDAFSDGDGSYDRNRLYNTSLPLMNSLQEILLKLGYSTNLYNHGGRREECDEWLTEYQLSWSSDSNISLRHKLPEEVNYSGMVYCATVPYHLLLVRRNGKAVWCGNSTPNGEDNDFCEMYKAAKEGKEVGKSVFTAHFYPWTQHPEYQLDKDSPYALPADNVSPLQYSEDELKLANNYNATEEQIRWRRRKIAEVESMRRSGETRLLFSQEYPENDIDCFLAAGDMVYDGDNVNRLAKECYPAPYSFQSAQVWYPPEQGKRYLIGIDPGLGKESKSVATVWHFADDKFTHCATLGGLYVPDIMAGKVIELGGYYNKALLAAESNIEFVTHIKNYPNLYYRQDILSGKVSNHIGWQTSRGNKQYMITELNRNLTKIITHDNIFVSQLRNLRYYGEKIISIGSDDYHDSAAIAIVCRDSMPITRGIVGSCGWTW